MKHYLQGLNKNLSQPILIYGEPANLNEAIATARRLNANLETMSKTFSFNSTQSSRSTNRHPYHDPNAMEVDQITVKNGHLTKEEKHRRLSLKLCLYCGKSGHQRTDCPSRRGKDCRDTATPSVPKTSTV